LENQKSKLNNLKESINDILTKPADLIKNES